MKKSKITGWTGTLVLHAALFLLLWMIAIRKPQAQEEGGVPVMLGETALSQGFSGTAIYITDITRTKYRWKNIPRNCYPPGWRII